MISLYILVCFSLLILSGLLVSLGMVRHGGNGTDQENNGRSSLRFVSNDVPEAQTPTSMYTRETLETSITFDPFSKTNTPCASRISGHAIFFPGDFICSPNKTMFFGLDDNGHFGIWRGAKNVWSGNNCCQHEVRFANFQRDGNLVVYDKEMIPLWESSTSGPGLDGGELQIDNDGIVTIKNDSIGRVVTLEPSIDLLAEPCATELRGVARLAPGDHICSLDASRRFGVSIDGDLGIWNGPKQIWSAGTCCKKEETIAYLQIDGNFVVRSESSEVLWQSETFDTTLMGRGVVKISPFGVVTIINEDSRKRLTIIPQFPDAEIIFDELSSPKNPKHCTEQVPGRIRLQMNDYICSPSGDYRFGVSPEGDLHLQKGTETAWSAATCCANDDVYAGLQRVDGNLVVRKSNREVLWSSGTGDPLHSDSSLTLTDSGVVAITDIEGSRVWAVTGSLADSSCLSSVAAKGTDLVEGQFMCSPNMRYRFGVIDSTLSLWDQNLMIWSLPKCCGDKSIVARMRSNGNLVVVALDTGEPLWISRTAASDGCRVQLADDGVIRIFSCGGEVLWSTSQGIGQPRLTPPAGEPSMAPSTSSECQSSGTEQAFVCVEMTSGPIRLDNGSFVCSRDRLYRFGLTTDGDLALLNAKSERLWSAGTACQGVTHAKLQIDGNLVVSSVEGAVWTSRTANQHRGEVSLSIGDDGIVTLTCSIRGHLWSTIVADDTDRVDLTTLDSKVMAGYQGWFFAPGDGGWNEWVHWSTGRTIPSPDTITIDYWPDLRELDEDELYPTHFRYQDGSKAGLYSAYNRKTVERHFKWMHEYGIHGVFAQRFIGNAMRVTDIVDAVLANVRSGAEKYGRVFANMYDISNHKEDGDTLVQNIMTDWMRLVDEKHITSSKQYLRHKGKPLIGIWGFGVHDRTGEPHHLIKLLDWFHFDAAPRYRATVMGGVPEGWRDLSRSSKTNHNWALAFRSYDVISPWSVGRIRNLPDVDKFRQEYIDPDKVDCDSLNIDYLPVVFPGFSFHNLYPHKEPNEIPRLGGTFFWRQLFSVVAAGNQMVYIAMFDEVDEGTAIFKLAENDSQTPTKGMFVTLDADSDYPNVPSDWYLRLTGEAARLISEGQPLPKEMPNVPATAL